MFAFRPIVGGGANNPLLNHKTQILRNSLCNFRGIYMYTPITPAGGKSYHLANSRRYAQGFACTRNFESCRELWRVDGARQREAFRESRD